MKSALMTALIYLMVMHFLTGCTSLTDVTKLSDYPSAPATKDPAIFTGKSEVKQSYREIAMISVDDNGWGKSDSQLIKDLQRKAREIGADAIVLTDRGGQSQGGVIMPGGAFVTSSTKVLHATAIVFEGKP